MPHRAWWVAVATCVVLAALVLAAAVLLTPAPGVRQVQGPASPASPTQPPSPSPTSTPTSTPTPTTTSTPVPSPPSGTRPDRYPIEVLAPGEEPPQFVVVSFDGGCSNTLWRHYLDLGDRTGARFTFFLSGTCLVPEDRASLYEPPRKPVGSSVVGFADRRRIPDRIRNLARAWSAGHEIGTHFLGHFCDADGVGTWTSAEWRSELRQAERFLDDWRTITGIDDPALDLPFTWADVTGDRTPCLAGRRDQLHPVLEAEGFRYDASDPGTLTWPRKARDADLWLFPLQTIPVVGYGRSALSMDYNFLVVQNDGSITADAQTCARIEDSTYRSYVAALRRQLDGNRAPLSLGNHFNTWACGAYRDALTRFVQTTTERRPEVRFVTFDYLARWLDAQDPSVLRALLSR